MGGTPVAWGGGEHTGTWVEHHALELVRSVQTTQMRQATVLREKHPAALRDRL